MQLPRQSKAMAVVAILFAVALANAQDAVVKHVSSDLPVYETVLFRTVTAFPLVLGWLFYSGAAGQMFAREQFAALLGRSLILCSAYFAFVLSIAAMPLATAVSIYFTMPFFVAGLSGFGLSERVPVYRWIAIIIGFAGVLINVRPSLNTLQPGMFLALYSAFGYAFAQMWGHKLSHRVAPVVIANWQNLTYFLVALTLGLALHFTGHISTSDKAVAFLTRPWSWPDASQISLLVVMGLLSVAASIGFIFAYRLGEANFVAPFEYSAIIWATLSGALFFNDLPDKWNLVGTALVIAAGLYMLWMDSQFNQVTG
jgi:drug/metabolite transporter (DMT)-like permease